VHIRKLAPHNWAESWKRHFKPIEIGRSLLIKPSWSRKQPRKGQALVVLDPGLSFGTGQHATTSFCLQQLAANRKSDAAQSLLDMGSGSGILAICAAKLGYTPVDAFDFDPEAVRVSLDNARANGVGDLVIPTRKDLTRLPLRSRRQYDVVCANLMHDLLISQAEKICARVKPAGRLILAGILAIQYPRVLDAFEKQGFRQAVTRVEKEWQSVELKRA
jgi:ribosomal protein L11 methyltransferase